VCACRWQPANRATLCACWPTARCSIHQIRRLSTTTFHVLSTGGTKRLHPKESLRTMHTLLAYGLKRLLCRLQCAHFLTGTHPQSYTMLTILGVYRPNRHELTASHTDTVAPAMSLCTKFWRLHHEFCMSNCRGHNHEFGILSFRGSTTGSVHYIMGGSSHVFGVLSFGGFTTCLVHQITEATSTNFYAEY
jgi:hypothetical protein